MPKGANAHHWIQIRTDRWGDLVGMHGAVKAQCAVVIESDRILLVDTNGWHQHNGTSWTTARTPKALEPLFVLTKDAQNADERFIKNCFALLPEFTLEQSTLIKVVLHRGSSLNTLFPKNSTLCRLLLATYGERIRYVNQTGDPEWQDGLAFTQPMIDRNCEGPCAADLVLKATTLPLADRLKQARTYFAKVAWSKWEAEPSI